MGSDESHLNVSVGSDGQSHETVSTNHNLFEEKGEPKRYRTEVLPLTSLTPYRWAKPARHYPNGVDFFYLATVTLLARIAFIRGSGGGGGGRGEGVEAPRGRECACVCTRARVLTCV